MTDQLTPDLETRLQAWLAGRAPSDVPPVLVERVIAIPRSAQPVATLRREPVAGVGRRMRPLFAAAAILVLMGLVVAGGLFVAASRRDAPTPSASASPSPTLSATPVPASAAPSLPAVLSNAVLPAAIPDGIEHGTIDTPLGSARWVHLQGDQTTLPDPVAPIRMHDGRLAWFNPGGPGAACFNDPTSTACTDPPRPSLTVASDILAERASLTLPRDSATADLRLVGDTYWFVTPDPVSVWTSKDLETWQKTDVSALRSPGPASLDWKVALGPDTVVGDTTLAGVTYTARDPGSLLGHPGENVRLGIKGTDGFAAFQSRSRAQGGDIDLGAIAVEETGDGLRFRDAAGVEVGRVGGVGLEFVVAWAQRGEIRYDRLATFDSQTWSEVDLPVAQLADYPTIVPVDGSTMVFVVEPEGVRSWRTTDGRAWSGGQFLVDGAGKTLAVGGVSYRETAAGKVLIADGNDGSFWQSTDGDDWVAVPEDPGQPPVTKFEGGWLRTADQTEDGTWQASRDGKTFEEVPALQDLIDKTAPLGAGGSSEFAIGNTVFFMVEEGEAPFARDLWMIEFGEAGP